MIEKESANHILKLTQNYLIKIYPAFFRTDSSNLNVIDYWIYGFQIGSYIFSNALLFIRLIVHYFISGHKKLL